MYLKEKNLYNKYILLQITLNKCKENNLIVIFFHLSKNGKSSKSSNKVQF